MDGDILWMTELLRGTDDCNGGGDVAGIVSELDDVLPDGDGGLQKRKKKQKNKISS